MKRSLQVFILIIIAGVIGAFIYWQNNKKTIIKKSLENVIAKKTDSLYYVHYDSSSIDEINGNAAFYEVVLQSDSAQKKQLASTDSLPKALYNIRIGKIATSGIDMSGLLQQQNVTAKKILLIKPVIQIINTGKDRVYKFTLKDTMEVYEKMLGKFNKISADTIQIVDGTVLTTNKAGVPQITVENINITLNKFLIDSTRNYESIISYFVKDVRATVENIQLPAAKGGTRINIEKLDYDAANKSLKVASVKQYKDKDMNPIIDMKNIRINELNTDAFITRQRLIAGSLSCDGGLVTIYKNAGTENKGNGNKRINLSSDLIDQVQVGSINLGNTKLVIIDKAKPAANPIILNDAKFNVLTPVKINKGTTVDNLIYNAGWQLSASSFTVDSKDGMYRTSINDFVINNTAQTARIGNFSMTPLLSEQQFVSHHPFSKDQYNFVFNDIQLDGFDVNKLLSTGTLEVESAILRPQLKVFNDKTRPPDGQSKLGKYPHQSLLKVDIPIYIRTLKIINGSLSYRERAKKSALIGNVFFDGLQATVSNITNIPGRIKTNPTIVVTANARFLGEGKLSTQWKLPLNANNGAFKIDGQLLGMNAISLNKITEPLAMASVKQGVVDKVKFDMNGTNTAATANVLFLYRDLKLDMLKKEEDEKELKKKGFISFLANTIIKDKNTNADDSKKVEYDRDITRSFFNLVWKTIYTGVKSTALGTKN